MDATVVSSGGSPSTPVGVALPMAPAREAGFVGQPGPVFFAVITVPVPEEPPALDTGDDSAARKGRELVEPPAQKFRRLTNEWRRATLHVSAASEILSHPAFLRLLGMGRDDAAPLILRSLEQRPSQLVLALPYFFEDDPSSPDDAGDLRAISAAWVAWGKAHGLV